MRILCKKCGDIIESVNWKVISCSCESIFIDTSPFYTRVGGNRKDMVKLLDVDENKNKDKNENSIKNSISFY